MEIKMLVDEQSKDFAPYCLIDGVFNRDGTAARATDFGGAAGSHTHAAAEIISGALPVERGGTGSVNAAAARVALGISPANIGAAAASHGTHVTYSTTAPAMDGAAGVGGAATLARSDHRHPTDTSRAAASHSHTPASLGAAAASHAHAASQVTAGTLGGRVLANAAVEAAVGTPQLRNIYTGTWAMTAGSTAMTTGEIYCQYE